MCRGDESKIRLSLRAKEVATKRGDGTNTMAEYFVHDSEDWLKGLVMSMMIMKRTSTLIF